MKQKREQNRDWDYFIEKLSKGYDPKKAQPMASIQSLLKRSEFNPGPGDAVLDLGCELGKNSLPFLEAGCKLSICDISPEAVRQCLNLFKSMKLPPPEHTYAASASDLPFESMGPFDTVVCSYLLAFFSERTLSTLMKRLSSRIVSGGYFAGAFFGRRHGWAETMRACHAIGPDADQRSLLGPLSGQKRQVSTQMNFLTKPQIHGLCHNNGLEILSIEEEERDVDTLSSGNTRFHVFHVVAKKLNCG